ncbi:MAG: hypothetical protein A4E45_00532 [Methanosaeta sp. PtaB.Bin039]|nr:MAG: hypothetical protein A4E45_00532 [Methanosaeta sp. PtaB.Bin039]
MRLRLLDQAADMAKSSIAADLAYPYLKGANLTKRSGINLISRLLLNCQALSSDGRLVDRGRAGDDLTIDCNSIARPYKYKVADIDILQAYHQIAAVPAHCNLVRQKASQRHQGLIGSSRNELLQEAADEQQDRHDSCCRIFANGDSRHCGDGNGDIRREVALPDAPES